MVKKISVENSIVLDFVRGISSQLVVIGHLLAFFSFEQKYNLPVIQNFGVIAFFVLSGFLITQTTLLKGIEYNFKYYLIDRFCRIFYTYIPALVFIVLVDASMIYFFNHYDESYKFNFQNFFANLFMLQSFPEIKRIGIEAFGSARPFWTVAIEWWIYVFFGVLFYLRKIKWNILVAGLFCISFVFVFYNINGRGIGLSIYWMMGMLISILYNKIELNISTRNLVLLLVMVFLGLLFRMILYRDLYDAGLVFIFSVLMFLLINPTDAIKKIITNRYFEKFSRVLASYSYSLYLIHYTVISAMTYFFKQDLDLAAVLIIFIIVNIIAYLFYLVFEKNNYKLKTRLKKIFPAKENPVTNNY